jgi:hypothetical protein
MNIIQVQDRLKGVTDDALIGYINNPTGDVPTYLALGEVERREDMRKEYQAAQAEQPQKTVAEEMVAKLSTPTGIGALTNNMGPEMPPEEVMSTSESISETGVATLPTPNMTQEFKRGGIVGDDGTIYGAAGFLVPAVGAGLRYLGGTALGQGIKRGVGSLFRKAKPPVKDPSAVIQRGIPNAPGRNISLPQAGPGRPKIDPGYFKQPGAFGNLAVDATAGSLIYGGVAYYMSEDGPVDEKGNPPPPEVADTITEQFTETVTEPEPTMEDKARKRMELFKEFAGEDEGAARIAERMAKMEERTADVEDQAFNDALITAGLGMAGGRDQNFLTNVAEGAKEGFKSYEGSMDKVRELEKETFAIDVELNKAKRAEQLAIASKGIDSIEAQEAAERASALQAQKDNAALARVRATVAAGQQLTEKDIIDAYTATGGYDSVTQQQLPYQQWKRNLLEQFPVDTPEIQDLVDKYAS